MYAHLTTAIIERYWRYVSVVGPDDCWLWTGARTSAGYGAYGIKGVVTGAHRISYYLAHGHLAPDLLVCHTCDEPACCNPAHLFAGTPLDNMRDKVKKGRQYRPIGSCNSRAKLNAEDVREIRAAYAQGRHYRDIAKEFGIHPYYVHSIVRGDSWAHV